MPVLTARKLAKIHVSPRGGATVTALESFDLEVEAGEFVAVMGPSGSGKTTLLQLLGGIERPTSGEVHIGGQRLEALRGDALALFRRRRLGFVFQDFNLLDSLTLGENIAVPLALDRARPEAIAARVAAVGERLGLGEALDRYPYEVSGGQKQRAAAARALVHDPALVLADEPTGNLDSRNARALLETLASLGADGATILMVTHDPAAASHAGRVVFIKDGRFFAELRRGADRRRLLAQVLDTLAAMGGEPLDLVHPRA
jgi:ABC-type lipoprotein export system ATPase subunit